MGVAAGPHENGLLLGIRLGHHLDCSTKRVADLIFGVVLDDSRRAEAQIENIDATLKDDAIKIKEKTPRLGDFVHSGRFLDDVFRRGVAKGNDKHLDSGAPGNTLEVVGVARIRACRDNAGNGRSVGKFLAVLILDSEEELLGDGNAFE